MKSLAIVASIVILSITAVISVILGFFIHKLIDFGKIWYLVVPVILLISFFLTLQIFRIFTKIKEKFKKPKL